MTRKQKIEWMAVWASKHGVALQLEGECGFGRECVGIDAGGIYPDYAWYDDAWERIDPNGDVWTPSDAYHKHPCVAVLGRGEEAEAQLYEWLRWFDDHGFTVETGAPDAPKFDPLSIMLGQHRYARMILKAKGEAEPSDA